MFEVFFLLLLIYLNEKTKHVFGVCAHCGLPGSESELRRNNFIMMEVAPEMTFQFGMMCS